MYLKRRLVDYHIHSSISCDGKSPLFEMCKKAVELGIEEIGFSEHVDFEPKDSGFGFFNYERYTLEIESAQAIFKNRLIIHKGVEIDYQHCFEDDIEECLKNQRLDFIIGSVHYLNHEIIGHRMVVEKDLREIYDAYFNEVVWSIKSGLFNVIGHFDLVSRYANNKKTRLNGPDYWEKVKNVLREIAERKVYLEINAKGLREAGNCIVPSREVIEKYVEDGGKRLSIGSDAHSTEEIGSGIHEILNSLAVFGNRIHLLFE